LSVRQGTTKNAIKKRAKKLKNWRKKLQKNILKKMLTNVIKNVTINNVNKKSELLTAISDWR